VAGADEEQPINNTSAKHRRCTARVLADRGAADMEDLQHHGVMARTLAKDGVHDAADFVAGYDRGNTAARSARRPVESW
jgi:hypothetical protein